MLAITYLITQEKGFGWKQVKSFIPTFASKLELDCRIQTFYFCTVKEGRPLYLLEKLLFLSDKPTKTYLITQENGLGLMHKAYLYHREEKKN
jgi:hypothetical protein